MSLDFGLPEAEPTAAERTAMRNPDLFRREGLARSFDAFDGGGPYLGAPPTRNAVEFNPDEYRAGIAERAREAFERPGVTVFSDEPGSGKTTTVGIEAAASGEPHALLFAMHAKARDYVTDDVTPDGYLELRGGSQPRHDCCMDERAAARLDPERSGGEAVCEEHGDASEWPLMCPAYRLDRDDPVRRRFDRLSSLVGAGEAHVILGDELHEGRCEWQKRQSRIQNADKIVGVHEHQRLKSIREKFRVITDETPRELKETRRISSAKLGMAANALERIPENGAVELSLFALRLRDALEKGEPVEHVEPPAIEWSTDERYPAAALEAGEAGIAGVKPRVNVRKAGTLAEIKVAYNERVRSALTDGRTANAPAVMDEILAAAAEAGLNRRACMRAISGPTTLRFCPSCGVRTTGENGALACPSCEWDERTGIPLDGDTEARALAWIDDGEGRNTDPELVFEVLPPVTELPSDPVVLDATASPGKIAAFYGVEPTDVTTTGTEPLAADMYVSQWLDGAYHASTIDRDGSYIKRAMQTAIDGYCEEYDKPLFGCMRKLIPLFEWPANAVVLHYGGARGLNLTECDAVVCLGAPHPNVPDLRRSARLLEPDAPSFERDGIEFSTREPADDETGVYGHVMRSYVRPDSGDMRYRGGDQMGTIAPGETVAQKVKEFSGMTGVLFREAREKEVEQFVHRVRPVLSEDTTYVYLMTNVPTNLPVNELVSWEGLSRDERIGEGDDYGDVLGGRVSNAIRAIAREGEFTKRDVRDRVNEWPDSPSDSTLDRCLREFVEKGKLEKAPASGPKPARYSRL